MKANHKWTVLAMAVSALLSSAAASAADNQDKSADIKHKHRVIEVRTNTTNTNTNNYTSNHTDTQNHSDTSSDTRTTNLNLNLDLSSIQHDERREKNNHAVDVSFKKELNLKSDVTFSGNPTITGNINLDSAAIAIVDNRQSITDNTVDNNLVENDASLADEVGSNASGNLGFNVAAGDNNTQDNAAALSAADASFSFGMADAEVFVNQLGAGNETDNYGVTNTAGLSGNAFQNASGNIAVNVTAGNNNEQKNALAASVATTAYATSSVSSNQISSNNHVSNMGHYEEGDSRTFDITLSGSFSGSTSGHSTSGTYGGTGNAYQMNNYYPEIWPSDEHPGPGSQQGHLDYDYVLDGSGNPEDQGAVQNPYHPGHGGIAFDTDEAGTLGFTEVGEATLGGSLSGSITLPEMVAVNITNTASLSGNAFSGASGNIGVNVSAGTGNLQANSLAMAVAQPAPGGAEGGGGGGTGGGNEGGGGQ